MYSSSSLVRNSRKHVSRLLHHLTNSLKKKHQHPYPLVLRFSSAAAKPSSSSSSAAAAAASSTLGRYLGYGVLLLGSGLATYYFYPYPKPRSRAVVGDDEEEHEEHSVANWSGTHEARTKVYIQPESLEELEVVVKLANDRKQRIRPVGSGLSPNGLGLSDEGMVNLALMDRILSVDQDTKRVTVQAGARVEQVVAALRSHGLTLQNFASIKEQQIGGFIQVGAHGTGAKIAPVDDHVVSLKLVTPGKGTLELSRDSDSDLFYLARCGLGALGVVAEVTLQCASAHKLLEKSFVTNMKQVQKNHKKWLQENKHLRYMWIPDTDTVVVVQCNPLTEGQVPKESMSHKYSEDERLSAARTLYREVAAKFFSAPLGHLSDEELFSLSFTELRDKLLAFDPLNKAHVIKVNQAEAEYWKKSEGFRVGWSDEILGFDCGGQQWVSEICFPVGKIQKPDLQDIKYIEQVLKLIKKQNIPAPAPIEQRWTASSKSPLSPASSSSTSSDALYSWVGIIMYLPTIDDDQRAAITKSFFEYRKATQQQLWDSFSAFEHWAKIEVAADTESLSWVQERLRKRFPVESFQRARAELDPNNILANDVVDCLFPRLVSTEA
ncbi:unnamed protein product [Sphagnum troendelagicum]|uniref:FAD-binding PCMH-type domain-containing protein n=1 Tax=Sphagnum troendelagicum TaxID=128251 RepID=A0ABP0TV19_9BRYO